MLHCCAFISSKSNFGSKSTAALESSRFLFLPHEIQSKIFSLLQISDLEICKTVCKRWNSIHYLVFTSLTIQKSDIRLDDVKNALRSFTNLRSITIRDLDPKILHDTLKWIAHFCKSLTEFHYINFHPSEGSEILIRQVILSNPNIQIFTFRNNNLATSVESLGLSLLTNLKEFDFGSQVCVDVPLTNSQLEKIHTLRYAFICQDPSRYPTNIFHLENTNRLKNLKSLKLSAFPNDFSLIKKCLQSIPLLENLDLNFWNAEVEFETFDLGPLPNLTHFTLHCQFTEYFNYALALLNMKNLKSLYFSPFTNNIDWIPVLTQLENFQSLTLELNCEENKANIQKLKIIQDLVQLRNLDLNFFKCSLLFESFGNLVNLQSLNLKARWLQNFTIKDISTLKSLKSLGVSLEGIGNLGVDLNWNQLANLESLSLRGCGYYKTLLPNNQLGFDSLGLKSLIIECDPYIDKLIALLGNITSLEYLQLYGSFIKKFPESLSNLKRLQTLKLSDFPKLKSLIFPRVCSLLHALHIQNCPKVTFLHHGIFDLKFLHVVELPSCSGLTRYRKKFEALNLQNVILF